MYVSIVRCIYIYIHNMFIGWLANSLAYFDCNVLHISHGSSHFGCFSVVNPLIVNVSPIVTRRCPWLNLELLGTAVRFTFNAVTWQSKIWKALGLNMAWVVTMFTMLHELPCGNTSFYADLWLWLAKVLLLLHLHPAHGFVAPATSSFSPEGC